MNNIKKLDALNLLINDLYDLRSYYEELEHAILMKENKETIENIKKCIKDFDLKSLIVILIEIMEQE